MVIGYRLLVIEIRLTPKVKSQGAFEWLLVIGY